MNIAALTAPEITAHTPGPWRVITPRKISDAAAGDWGDRAILAGEGPDTVMLAEVFERTVDKRHGTVEGLRLPTDRNAMLIAAAPEMLEALSVRLDHMQTILDQFEKSMQSQANHGPDAKLMVLSNYGDMALTALRAFVPDARAAIAKATGAQ